MGSFHIGFLLIAFYIDIQRLYEKYNLYKSNLLVSTIIKAIKYISFIVISLMVIKSTNTSLYDLLREDPKNYPASLASITFLMTPIIWFSTLLTFASIGSLLITMIMPFYLWFTSLSRTKPSVFSTIIRLIAFAAILGLLQGINNNVMPIYKKFLAETVVDTAFYKNESHCSNIEKNGLIAFTDKREEVLLFISDNNDKINYIRKECIQ